jgi:hypothetical protein
MALYSKARKWAVAYTMCDNLQKKFCCRDSLLIFAPLTHPKWSEISEIKEVGEEVSSAVVLIVLDAETIRTYIDFARSVTLFVPHCIV